MRTKKTEIGSRPKGAIISVQYSATSKRFKHLSFPARTLGCPQPCDCDARMVSDQISAIKTLLDFHHRFNKNITAPGPGTCRYDKKAVIAPAPTLTAHLKSTLKKSADSAFPFDAARKKID